MQAIKFIFAGLVMLTGLSINIAAQSATNFAKSREFETKARASYKAGDFPSFLENVKQAGILRPNHPRLIYNLAAAYAVNGKVDDALGVIKRLVNMGLYFPIEKDDDFKSLGTEKLASVVRLFEQNKQPANSSTRAFTLSDKELIPESIAFAPVTGKFYIGSIHKAKIVAVEKNGTANDLSMPTDGLWSVSGMKVDAKRRILWACTTAFPQMKGFDPTNTGRSGIAKYDLKTGKLLKKYILPAGENHGLGDLTLDSAGNVYATDSVASNIYRIDAKKDELEVFMNDPIFSSLQGLTFTRDEKILFVADYSKGIFRIDMASKRITQVIPSENITLLGIDGLYYNDGMLIGVQNGINPHRVVAITLNRDQTGATTLRTLEANHPDFNEPTLGVLIGNELYYVANSQWPLVNDKGVLDTEKLREPVILKLSLKKRARP